MRGRPTRPRSRNNDYEPSERLGVKCESAQVRKFEKYSAVMQNASRLTYVRLGLRFMLGLGLVVGLEFGIGQVYGIVVFALAHFTPGFCEEGEIE